MRLLLALDTLATLGMIPMARALLSLWRGLDLVPRAACEPDAPLVSVIVPARNEERSIEGCVASLLAQAYPHLEVIVVDDHSDDGTASIVARLAARDARLRLIRGELLPDGWIGKCWAAYQGARAARGEWLLFTDADTRHHPAMLASAMRYARERRADLLTLGPRQELKTFWERALLPAIFSIVITAAGTPDEVNDPSHPAAKASGQFLLFRSAVYWALGGHEAVRDELVEDFALARRVKGTGHRLVLADGRQLVTTRMYRSLGEIFEGFTKNAYFEARRYPAGVLAGVALPWLVVVTPPLAARALLRSPSSAPIPRSLATLALLQSLTQCALLAAFALATVRQVGLPWYWAASVPGGLVFFSVVLANATARVLSGRGVSWRGRLYHDAPWR